MVIKECIKWGVGLISYAHAQISLIALCHKMATTRRALHFVFKVADRTSTAAFYRDVLGMKVCGVCWWCMVRTISQTFLF